MKYEITEFVQDLIPSYKRYDTLNQFPRKAWLIEFVEDTPPVETRRVDCWCQRCNQPFTLRKDIYERIQPVFYCYRCEMHKRKLAKIAEDNKWAFLATLGIPRLDRQ